MGIVCSFCKTDGVPEDNDELEKACIAGGLDFNTAQAISNIRTSAGDWSGLSEMLFNKDKGLLKDDSSYKSAPNTVQQKIIDGLMKNNEYAKKNYVLASSCNTEDAITKSNLESECKKAGYSRDWKTDINTVMSGVMALLQSARGEKEDIKKLLYNYYFMYSDFKAPSSVDTDQDCIKKWLSIGYTYISEAFPTTFEEMCKNYNFKSETSFKGSTVEVQVDSVNNIEIYEATIIAIIKSTYVYMASVLLNEFFVDCAKEPSDTTRIMRAYTAENAGAGTYVVSESKVMNVLNTTIKKALVDLWGQLIISFWIPRLYDSYVAKDKDGKEIDMRAKLIYYMTNDANRITNDNVMDRVQATEDNITYWAKFIIFHDIVAKKQYASSSTDTMNRFSTPCFGAYLRAIGKYANFAQTTKDAFAHGRGLPTYNTHTVKYEYSTAEFEKILAKLESTLFNNGVSASKTSVLSMPKSTFVPNTSLTSLCECHRYDVLKTVALIVILFSFVVGFGTFLWMSKMNMKRIEYDKPKIEL